MRRRLEDIQNRLAEYEASTIDTTISESDDMYDGGLESYLGVGVSAVYLICNAMMLAGVTRFRHVLDMPCGFGRVLRHLVECFADSSIVACDLDREAVDFCKKTFDVDGVYSRERFDDIRFDSTFDLIWCGSLLTHLPQERFKEAMRLFVRFLSPDGVAIITLHGRYTLTVQEKYLRLLPDDLFSQARQEFLDKGFGFGEYDGYEHRWEASYGVSLTAPSFVLGIVEKIPEVQICCYSERAWAGFHDVLIIRKEPASAAF